MPQISSSLLLVLSLYCTLVSGIESEAQALLTWRSSLKYTGNLTQMWSDHISSDPCHWDGIKCNDVGSITSIIYYANNPSGGGPPIDGTLSKFNFSLLPNLIEFSFYSNNLYGEIPEEIGYLHNLETLGLGNNSLTGQFPTAILNLSNIISLDLFNNKFTGKIPSEIEKLSNVQALDLSDNDFIGEIPKSLGNLSQLSSLSLGDNHFTGTIPKEIGHLYELYYLGLNGNRLSGHIPVQIGNLTWMGNIDFGYNELQGEVPTLNMQLYQLKLNNNQLTGGFPYLGNNSKPFLINLSNNKFIGTVPPFMCRGILQYFYGSSNYFDNLLPITLQNCTNLGILDLRNNNIKTDISYIFDNLPELYYLDLSQNYFYGSLPSSLDGELPSGFVNTTQLEVINLDSNNLMGSIPLEFVNLPYLSIFILSNNKFSSLPMINAYNLSSLHLNNNKLGGGFPLLAGNWTKLVTLDIGDNNFFGEIPLWTGSSFPILKILRLRSNRFNGTIPSSLSRLNGLQFLDLSNNNLSGPIPHIFSSMSSMAVKSSSNKSYINLEWFYNETIGVVWKGDGVTFQSTIDLLIGIDLSSNSLSGEIPKDLVKLQGLVFLNLSRNHLSSVIPYWIGNLTWLEILDLSMNHLSGTIPPSISHLIHLDTLILSHNKLTGQIPLGSQIQTFNPSSFSDNDGLCGVPLPNNCSTRDDSMVPLLINNGEDHKIEAIWIICATILGFIIGFWVYFGALFWRASLRLAIFHFTDELQDKIMKCFFR